MRNHGVFLDRDGTLVHPRHYPSRPEELVLYDDIGEPLRRLQQAGFRIIVITNQAGIARGYFDEAALVDMHTHLAHELALLDVHLDGVYFCPHHPDGIVAELAIRCNCRKPMPGMLLQAAADLDVDLAQSWFVGDILDDVEAGNRAGCSTVLVDIGTESTPTNVLRTPSYVARDTPHALQLIAAVSGLGGAADLEYRPERWEAGGDWDSAATSLTPGIGRNVRLEIGA